jgi:hypothetical protein
MPLGTEEDVWQIDPVTARVRPGATLHDPVLIVVEAANGTARPSLAHTVTEICDFLRIGLLAVSDPRDIPAELGDMQPIAVLHEADTMDCTVYDLMMIIAGLDTALPVMLVLPDDPQNRGAVETAQRLWQLTDVAPVHHRPGIRTLIDFLFRAGRRFGRTGPMPI